MKDYPAGSYASHSLHQHSDNPRNAQSRLGLLVALLALAASVTFSGCASQGLAGAPGSSALTSGPSPFATAGSLHDVSLNWGPSASPGIMGYNVYRGLASGGPYTRINLTVIPAVSYTDSAVISGQTYYYVVTAIDSGNVESVYSPEVSAAIP